MRNLLLVAAAIVAPCSAAAQTESASAAGAPLVVAAAPVDAASVMPSNTKVFMTMDEELTSKRAKEGTMFRLTVSGDVMHGNYVVIPRGTPAFGEVTWRTGRAVFGKSGKMKIELRYLDMNGRRIPVTGEYRQEGEGNTVAAVGAIVLAWPALFVTGKSARIPKGRELIAYTRDSLPIAPAAAQAAPAVETTPAPVQTSAAQ